MNFKLHWAFSIGILWVGWFDFSSAEDPAELIRLRRIYNERITEVKAPVTRKYITALGEFQNELVQSNDTEAALEILKERNRLSKLLTSNSDSSAQQTAKPTPEEKKSKPSPAEGQFDPVGMKWTWRPPGEEITFHPNGRAFITFPNLKAEPFPHLWKHLGPEKIEVRFRNSPHASIFRIRPDGKTGTVIYGDSNRESEVFLIASEPEEEQ